ncbi:MAG: L-threonylcarbamoyladenylate synthase, partial [Candidatus Dormibacterales bacterium]
MELLTDDAAGLRRAAHLLVRGGVVAFPTDTVYGLAALATDRTAVERVYRIKGRARDKPLVLMVLDASGLDEWAELSPAAASLAARWWPGPLTLVLKARAAVAPWLVAGDPPLIGVRVPDHAGARGLLAEVEGALATTSANASGRRPALT